MEVGSFYKLPLVIKFLLRGMYSLGAYYLSSAAAQRLLSIPLSKYVDTRVFGKLLLLSHAHVDISALPSPTALDYRLAPETNFPGPLHDAVSGYMRLTEDLRIPPENIILAGDSAGGGLCLALMMYLRDNDYPLPSAAILMSPWVGAYQLLQIIY